jgi:CBS domain containing-hemolysin-like protein
MVELILAVALVIIVSGLCSLSEAVLYSVPQSHIESLAQAQSKRGLVLKELKRHVERPIAALLSLNTVANTGGAALAGALADRALGTKWLGLFSILFTLVILVFSEIIPKTAGVIYSRPLSTRIARPLRALVWLFRPLVWLASSVTRSVAGGRKPVGISDEEILTLTRLGHQEGTIDQDEAAVIHNILALEEISVRDVLTPRTVLFALSGDVTVGTAYKQPQVLTHSRIPVFFKNLDDIGGIVHRRDILRAVAADKFDATIESLMRPAHFVPAKMKLNRTLQLFLERGVHLFVALDEFGGTSGVVTLEDVLEAILGKEIVDEFDEVADLRELAQKRREEALDAEARRRRSQ